MHANNWLAFGLALAYGDMVDVNRTAAAGGAFGDRDAVLVDLAWWSWVTEMGPRNA